MTRRSALTVALILYAATASTVGAALYQTRLGGFEMTDALAWQAAIYFSWAALVPLIVLAGRVRLRRGPRWLAPMPAYLALSIPLVAGHAILAGLLDRAMLDPTRADWTAFVLPRLPVDLLIYWAIVGVVYAIEYSGRVRAQERAAATLERELLRAQLAALRMQIEPHFLFNALQNLAVLVRTDPDGAVRMIGHLGDLMRAMLAREDRQTVPLRSELSLLGAYLGIERIRFGDRLSVEIDAAPETLELEVPDLVLQPLVENALRHGLSPRPGPGSLRVATRVDGGRLVCVVEDDGVGIAANARDGVGLENTRRRLEALYPQAHRLDVGVGASGKGTRVVVEIPARVAGPQLAEPVLA